MALTDEEFHAWCQCNHDVLEMYGQPTHIQLHYHAQNGLNTRTPNTEQRWAMQKTIWEVVGGERT